jgi:hypothetical protein
MRDKRMEADRRTALEEVEPERDMKTMACRRTTEVRLEEKREPTSMDRKPEAAERREVPVKDATVIPVRKPKRNRRRYRRPTAGNEKERTQGKDGYRKRLTAAGMMTHRLKVTRCKENFVGKVCARAMWYEEPRQKGLSGGDINRDMNAKVELRTEEASSHYTRE